LTEKQEELMPERRDNRNRGFRNNKDSKGNTDARVNRGSRDNKENKEKREEKPREQNTEKRAEKPRVESREKRVEKPRGEGREKEYKVELPLEELEGDDQEKLEGRNSVLEALKANRSINKIFISKGDKEGSIKQIIAIAREKGVIIKEVERGFLDNMSSTHAHQGVIAYVSVKEYVEVDDILNVARERNEAPFIILLDEITDPHNLGSILRTANAVGAHGVVIPKRRAIGLTASVSKASAGAVEYVPVARVTNLGQTIDYLKKNNIWVVGTDISGEKSFYASDLKGPVALVIGSEGEGIGRLVREKCDFVVNIPMRGQISSLNAAVAGAIVMYEILKQRSV
jgi:23S rRNA (guanosine2251-2'-O)-methyltransferase